MDIRWAQTTANLTAAQQLMDEAIDSDLYVLPEMFSTGYVTNPFDIADGSEETLNWMKKQSRQRDAAICGSVSTKTEDGTYHNRLYFVKPDGSVSFYDKHHLFAYGGENKTYTAGQQRIIVLWRGVRILPLVCYDLRFPVWSRNNAPVSENNTPYDLCIYVASWPSSRHEAWNTLLRARAIENQCYVVGVNRIGTDPNCGYIGGTQVIDAYGRIIDYCPDNKPSTISTDIELVSLHLFRDKFPVLKDADKYAL